MGGAQVFRWSGRPERINDDRRSHFAKEALTKQWRKAGWAAAVGKPKFDGPVEIHVQPTTSDDRRADAGACVEVVKAIIDGFEDAGLLPNDGPDVVKCLHMHAPENTGRDELIIEVVPVTVRRR